MEQKVTNWVDTTKGAAPLDLDREMSLPIQQLKLSLSRLLQEQAKLIAETDGGDPREIDYRMWQQIHPDCQEYLKRRITEELGLDPKRVNIGRYRIETLDKKNHSISALRENNIAQDKVEAFMGHVDALIEKAIEPYKGKEFDVLARP